MSPSKAASAVVAVITIFLVVIFATSESGVERLRTHLVGEVAPPISGETSDGGYWSLDEVRGRWLLVNFFFHNLHSLHRRASGIAFLFRKPTYGHWCQSRECCL